jgi:hypothetical protein
MFDDVAGLAAEAPVSDARKVVHIREQTSSAVIPERRTANDTQLVGNASHCFQALNH